MHCKSKCAGFEMLNLTVGEFLCVKVFMLLEGAGLEGCVVRLCFKGRFLYYYLLKLSVSQHVLNPRAFEREIPTRFT